MIIKDNKDVKYYPLTHSQKRIWYIEKIHPLTSINNIGGSVLIKGPVKMDLLEESINIFIEKNEGVRLRIIERNGEIKQFVYSYTKYKLNFYDFSQFKNPEEEFNIWMEEEAKKPFNIENNPLYFFALYKLSDNNKGYFAKFNHIIADGWSINVMTEQICSNYMNLLIKKRY